MLRGLLTDQWKKSVDDYVGAAKGLLKSMQMWFPPSYSVPIDPDGELLDGSHRVACALALGKDEIPVRYETRKVWAPAWDRQWFLDHQVSPVALTRIENDFILMTA